MSVSASIPDTSLGLTSSEIQILRQQQQIALQGGHTGGGISRGRGIGRTSNSSSRAASAASSHGRLLLDPMSLRALSHQLGNLQEQIRNRLDYVCLLLSFAIMFAPFIHRSLFPLLRPLICGVARLLHAILTFYAML